MTNLSNAPFSPAIQPALSSLSVSQIPNFNSFSVSGATSVEGADVNTQLGAMLVYPQDAGKYIFTMSIQQYTRSTLQTVGQYESTGYPGIVLPMPMQLVNTNESLWSEEDAGVMGLLSGAVSLGGKLVGAVAGRGAAAAGQAQQAAAGVEGAAGQIGGGLAGIAKTFLGVQPNQFQTMLFRGPSYKRHEFTWQLSPQNFQEADTIRMIVNTMQNAMAPATIQVFGQVGLWAFPMVFRIRLYPNSKWLYKFKPCVLEHLVINYTPAERPSFLRNVNGVTGENPPEGVTIQARFIEIEYWVAGQVSNLNDPDDVDLNGITTSIGAQVLPTGQNLPIPSTGGGQFETAGQPT